MNSNEVAQRDSEGKGSEAKVEPAMDEELAELERLLAACDGHEYEFGGSLEASVFTRKILGTKALIRVLARLQAEQARADSCEKAIDLIAQREDEGLYGAHANGRAEAVKEIVVWCRTTLAQNRNAQALANDIEAGVHLGAQGAVR